MGDEDVAVLRNEMGHVKDAVNELKAEVVELRTCVQKVKLGQAKLIGILSAVGTLGGGAGAAVMKLLSGA